MRKLHIGGTVRQEGWEVFNAFKADYVDHVGNAADLSRFKSGSFEKLYASHVLEHFDYMGELLGTLKEWYRVLANNGQLYISVPDMDVICRLFIAKDQLTVQERFDLMRILFGGHTSEYDYHKVGLNREFLLQYLKEAGFDNIFVVENLGVFHDMSTTSMRGIPISLNVIAQKGEG